MSNQASDTDRFQRLQFNYALNYDNLTESSVCLLFYFEKSFNSQKGEVPSFSPTWSILNDYY